MDAEWEDESIEIGIGFHQIVSLSAEIIATVRTDYKVWRSRLICKSVGADGLK